MTLGTIKQKKHQDFLARNQARKEAQQKQIQELQKKIAVYEKFKDLEGIELSKKDQNKLFEHDTAQVETLISREVIKQRDL